MKIGDKLRSSASMPSGFDYMRLILALSVLAWHSFQMSYGTTAAQVVWGSWVGWVLQIILPVFFALSGFLVTSSLERAPGLTRFLLLRGIRIYPALMVEVVLSAFILGPIITVAPIKDYFRGSEFVGYLENMVGYIHYRLPGVFLLNPVPRTVNTSLWTVPFELECYISLAILVLIGYMRHISYSATYFIMFTILTASWMMITHQSGTPPGGLHGRVLVLCFLAGSLLFRLKEFLPYDRRLAVSTTVLSMILLRYDILVYASPIFVAYATTYVGLQNPKRIGLIKSGDYSYGTYLYAGPIQQTVALALGARNTYLANFLTALPLTMCFAALSWHLVEKPFLRVKKLVLNKKSSAVAQNSSPKDLNSASKLLD